MKYMMKKIDHLDKDKLFITPFKNCPIKSYSWFEPLYANFLFL